jgi:hypothetical protein
MSEKPRFWPFFPNSGSQTIYPYLEYRQKPRFLKPRYSAVFRRCIKGLTSAVFITGENRVLDRVYQPHMYFGKSPGDLWRPTESRFLTAKPDSDSNFFKFLTPIPTPKNSEICFTENE